MLAAGYTGPLSLEVFNDVFRQADPARAAVDAMRSLLWLGGGARGAASRPRRWPRRPRRRRCPATRSPSSPSTGCPGREVAGALTALGFTHTGQHRSKPVQLWEQGAARVLLNASVVRPAGAGGGRGGGPGAGEHGPRPVGRAGRGAAWRRSSRAPAAPPRPTCRRSPPRTGRQVFFARTGPDGWPADFLPTGDVAGAGAGLTAVDHVALTQPFDAFDEAGLFYRSVLGLEPETVTEYAAPFGIVRSRAVTGPDRRGPARAQRLPAAPRRLVTRRARAAVDRLRHRRRRRHRAGACARPAPRCVAVPANYHDDLDARLDLDPRLLADMREYGLFYDEDAHGGYLHLVTEVLGARVFFEVVQRLGGYDGYGTANAPVRMAAHRRLRAPAE